MSARDTEASRWAQSLGEALKALREEQGMSPSTLAKRASLSASTVRIIERGKGNPHLSTMDSLGQALRVGASGIASRSEQLEAAKNQRS